ncbi:MAG TPA: hypothetical protein VF331_08775 [Polyangiales bacterium]
MGSDQPRPLLKQLPLAGLLVAGVARLAYGASYTVDDAYITLRYSRNLARGAGAVFNPGEYVKGYSNTLYMWLMTLPELLHHDPIGFSKLIGAAAYLGLLLVLLREGRALFASQAAAFGAPGLALLSMPLALWYMAGLETGLYTTCVVTAVVKRLREQERELAPYSAAWFAAAALLRPEGIIFFVAMAGHDVVVKVFARKRPSLRDVLWCVLPASVYGAELLVSKAYYGAYFPSTYYAKVAGSQHVLGNLAVVWRGLCAQWSSPNSYVRTCLGTVGGLWGIGLAAIGLVQRSRLRQHSAFALMLMAQVAFIARADGDWMPAWRFCVPLLPFVFLLIAGGIAGVVAALPRMRDAAANTAWLAGLAALALTAPFVLHASDRALVSAPPFLRQGEAFASLLPPGALLSSFDVGGYGYGGGSLDILDMAGLTSDIITRCNADWKPCYPLPALVMPDFVRRHPGKRKGDIIYKLLRSKHGYLVSANGRYLVKQELVLASAPPATAHSVVSHGDPAHPQVMALELAAHSGPSRRLSGVMYWRGTDTNRAAVRERKLVWMRAQVGHDAAASVVFWSYISAPEQWDTRSLFVDRFTLDAPAAAGTYDLAVELGDGSRQAVGSLEVVEGATATQAASSDVARARARAAQHDTEAAFALVRDALAAADSELARNLYDRLAVERAHSLVASSSAARTPEAKAPFLRQARQLLHQTYWETGRASTDLRRAIDEVGRLQREILLGLWQRGS